MEHICIRMSLCLLVHCALVRDSACPPPLVVHILPPAPPPPETSLEACAHPPGVALPTCVVKRCVPMPCAGPGARRAHPRTGAPDRVHAGCSTAARAEADDR